MLFRRPMTEAERERMEKAEQFMVGLFQQIEEGAMTSDWNGSHIETALENQTLQIGEAYVDGVVVTWNYQEPIVSDGVWTRVALMFYVKTGPEGIDKKRLMRQIARIILSETQN